MNEHTTKLIEQLASKLGTTAEYLWSVLIKQAHVSGIKSIVFILLSILCQYGLYKAYRYAGKVLEDGTSDFEEGIQAGRVFLIAAFIILCFAIFFDISNVMTAFLNPEFWAIDYIMDKV